MEVYMLYVYVIAGLGVITLIGVFARMKPGFGPYNVRILSIVIVAVFACVLGMINEKALMAAMGILGTIVGYAFGSTNATAQTASKEDTH